jgi:probable H4MPT-linked C1 transfer pathway protein
LAFDLTMSATLGWDIGGVNTKVARVAVGVVLTVRSLPFELQRDPGALVEVLRQLAADTGADDTDVHAVTMTAELSQMFRTKSDGVRFVLDAVAAAFPGASIHVYTVLGRFISVADAARAPLLVSAANWAAAARVVAHSMPDGLFIDIGTTSTDIIPIAGGVVAARGWTDPDRLASGELVYTGAVRTPVEALARSVPFGAGEIGLSAEGFALSGDVHLWRGDLTSGDYSAPTPDGRPATRQFAGERLARAICADRDMVDESGVTAIADALAAAQVTSIADAITTVRRRHPLLRTAMVTGLGAFIAARAARQAGLDLVAPALGDAAARCAPAAAVALLFDAAPRTLMLPRWDADRTADASPGADVPSAQAAASATVGGVQTVVKVGGGLLAHDRSLEAVLTTLARLACDEPLLIVPGGGPFADVVRAQAARVGLSDDAAHWMAVLAMDQYAYLIASRLQSARVVFGASGMLEALRSRQIPVLAPFTWLHREDTLPHSWQVTSDSIAAWVANTIGARRLVLVKPPGSGQSLDIVDDYFARARMTLSVEVIPADAIDTLRPVMRG